MTALLMTLAVALDWFLGAPRLGHPGALLARLAAWLERHLAGGPTASPRLRGLLALVLLLLPALLLVDTLANLPDLWGTVFSFWTLLFSLGHKRVHEAARAEADTASATASCRRALKNGGVFGVLFWFLVGGAAGAVLFRLAVSLAARSDQDREFGWAAAQLADMLNIVPAMLAALSYALLGRTRQALDCWRVQAPEWDDHNTAMLLAAGGGALNLRLEPEETSASAATDAGVDQLGQGEFPVAADIDRALTLLRQAVLLWLALICVITALWYQLELSSLTLPDGDQIMEFLHKYVLA